MSESELDTLQATKYLSGVALTLLMYDHVIHIEDEVALVWCQPPTLLSVFVMAEMYVREIGLAYMVAVVSGTTDQTHYSCVVSTWFVIVYSLLSTGSVHSLLLYRVFRLWDNRTIVQYVIIAGFVLSFAGTIACAISAADALAREVQVSPIIRTCIFPYKSWFATASWAVVILYDLFVLVVVVVNAFGKPRRSDMDIVRDLYTDGFLIFLVRLSGTPRIEVVAERCRRGRRRTIDAAYLLVVGRCAEYTALLQSQGTRGPSQALDAVCAASGRHSCTATIWGSHLRRNRDGCTL
ncbi:uncharacterized protein C8Q71DRAFT_742806, partial [Rhodofomes roseus]